MLVTLALVIFSAAIIILFSQEIIGTIKKIVSLKGAGLILPLAIASWVVYTFDYWMILTIYYYREVLHVVVKFLTHIIPFAQASSYVAIVLLLILISIVPVLLLDWIFQKQTLKPYPYPYLTSTLIWLVSALTLVII